MRQENDLVQGVGGRVGGGGCGVGNIHPDMFVRAAFGYYHDFQAIPTLIQITETNSNTHLSDGLRVNYVLCSQS